MNNEVLEARKKLAEKFGKVQIGGKGTQRRHKKFVSKRVENPEQQEQGQKFEQQQNMFRQQREKYDQENQKFMNFNGYQYPEQNNEEWMSHNMDCPHQNYEATESPEDTQSSYDESCSSFSSDNESIEKDYDTKEQQFNLSFLPLIELIKYQRINKMAYSPAISGNQQSVKIAKIECEEDQYFYSSDCGWIFQIKIQHILNQENPKWEHQLPILFGNEEEQIDDLFEEPQSMLLDHQRLYLVDKKDNNMIIHLTDKTIELLPKQGIKRENVGIMYRKKDQYLWVLGGLVDQGCQQQPIYSGHRQVTTNQHTYCRSVLQLDLNNQKWKTYPDLINDHECPGALISADNSYLWVFTNFKCERLNLQDKYPHWENQDFKYNILEGIKTIPHQTNPNIFYSVGAKSCIILEIQGMGIQQKLKIKKVIRQSDQSKCDSFYNSNPIYVNNKLVYVGYDHLHIMDLKTKKHETRQEQGTDHIY